MDQIFTPETAAMYARVSRGTIYKWIKAGMLGDANHQNARTGRGNGYQIRQSALDAYLRKGATMTKKEPKPVVTDDKKAIKESKNPDLESMRIAAANLRIAIEFAQDELSKIEKLL